MTITTTYPSASRFEAFKKSITKGISAYATYRRNQAAHAKLLHMSDRMLADMGVTRNTVHERMSQPFISSFIPDMTPYQLDEFTPGFRD